MTVSVADAAALGKNKLVVTYAYKLGARTKSFDQLCEEGKEIARQHNARWSENVTYVQKTFAAADLPATFEIDCPTPRGQYPVYPRMLFLRREVLAPGSKPLPLPAGAVAAAPQPGDELATLPNPFLIGSEQPQASPPQAVVTTRLPLRYVQFCTEKGEVADNGLMAWPKNAQEEGKVIRGAVLVDGDLPVDAKRKLVAARLVVPVSHGHSNANGKVGAVFLAEAIKPGEACSFKRLDDVAGTTVVPVQPGDTSEYKPAKPFAIDVTRSVKAVVSGAAPWHGVALRIVPDRSVDDGYTVRCRVAPRETIYLELDFKADAPARTRRNNPSWATIRGTRHRLANRLTGPAANEHAVALAQRRSARRRLSPDHSAAFRGVLCDRR